MSFKIFRPEVFKLSSEFRFISLSSINNTRVEIKYRPLPFSINKYSDILSHLIASLPIIISWLLKVILYEYFRLRKNVQAINLLFFGTLGTMICVKQ